MGAWHRSRRADLSLRASGLLLCGIAYTAVSRLCAMYVSPQTADVFAYAFAVICFLGARAETQSQPEGERGGDGDA